MTYENSLKAARERVFQAEEAMEACLHSPQFDSERFRRLADEVSASRSERLERLSALRPPIWGNPNNPVTQEPTHYPRQPIE